MSTGQARSHLPLNQLTAPGLADARKRMTFRLDGGLCEAEQCGEVGEVGTLIVSLDGPESRP